MNYLYFDPHKKQHFYCGDTNCNLCNKDIQGSGIYIIKHYRKKKKSNGILYCINCVSKIKQQKNYDDLIFGSEIISVLIKAEPPVNSILIPLRRISLGGNPDMLCTWAATNNKGLLSESGSCKINDYTRLAGRESFEGLQIGLDNNKIDYKKSNLDAPLDIDSFNNMLLDIKNSRVLKDKSNILKINHNTKMGGNLYG